MKSSCPSSNLAFVLSSLQAPKGHQLCFFEMRREKTEQAQVEVEVLRNELLQMEGKEQAVASGGCCGGLAAKVVVVSFFWDCALFGAFKRHLSFHAAFNKKTSKLPRLLRWIRTVDEVKSPLLLRSKTSRRPWRTRRWGQTIFSVVLVEKTGQNMQNPFSFSPREPQMCFYFVKGQRDFEDIPRYFCLFLFQETRKKT